VRRGSRTSALGGSNRLAGKLGSGILTACPSTRQTTGTRSVALASSAQDRNAVRIPAAGRPFSRVSQATRDRRRPTLARLVSSGWHSCPPGSGVASLRGRAGGRDQVHPFVEGALELHVERSESSSRSHPIASGASRDVRCHRRCPRASRHALGNARTAPARDAGGFDQPDGDQRGFLGWRGVRAQV